VRTTHGAGRETNSQEGNEQSGRKLARKERVDRSSIEKERKLRRRRRTREGAKAGNKGSEKETARCEQEVGGGVRNER